MGRRRVKNPPPKESAGWESYTPRQAHYWLHGGPFVPVARIEPDRARPDDIAAHLKDHSEARVRHAQRKLEEARKDLGRYAAWYEGAHERGWDALEGHANVAWYREQDEKLLADPTRRGVEPTQLQYPMASFFGEIRYKLHVIASCEALIARLERGTRPLFHLG